MGQFSKNARDRIGKAVRNYELQPKNQVAGSNSPVFTGGHSKIAITTSTITAKSGSTFGTGTATLQVASGTSWTSMGVSVTVYNMLGASIASGRMIQIKVIDGQWFADVDGC